MPLAFTLVGATVILLSALAAIAVVKWRLTSSVPLTGLSNPSSSRGPGSTFQLPPSDAPQQAGQIKLTKTLTSHRLQIKREGGHL
jgi:hypothetical protein